MLTGVMTCFHVTIGNVPVRFCAAGISTIRRNQGIAHYAMLVLAVMTGHLVLLRNLRQLRLTPSSSLLATSILWSVHTLVATASPSVALVLQQWGRNRSQCAAGGYVLTRYKTCHLKPLALMDLGGLRLLPNLIPLITFVSSRMKLLYGLVLYLTILPSPSVALVLQQWEGEKRLKTSFSKYDQKMKNCHIYFRT